LEIKADKYARPDTLLLIGLTACSEKNTDLVRVLSKRANVRICSAEALFRFIGGNSASIRKVHLCCEMTRKGNIDRLIDWKQHILTNSEPSFMIAEQSLEKSLENDIKIPLEFERNDDSNESKLVGNGNDLIIGEFPVRD
jgi:hypothetical protein